MHVFQWHYRGADLPEGADRLVRALPEPGDPHGSWALRAAMQCHGEPISVQAAIRRTDEGWLLRPGTQDAGTQENAAARHTAAMQGWIGGFVGSWLAEATAAR